MQHFRFITFCVQFLVFCFCFFFNSAFSAFSSSNLLDRNCWLSFVCSVLIFNTSFFDQVFCTNVFHLSDCGLMAFMQLVISCMSFSVVLYLFYLSWLTKIIARKKKRLHCSMAKSLIIQIGLNCLHLPRFNSNCIHSLLVKSNASSIRHGLLL